MCRVKFVPYDSGSGCSALVVDGLARASSRQVARGAELSSLQPVDAEASMPINKVRAARWPRNVSAYAIAFSMFDQSKVARGYR